VAEGGAAQTAQASIQRVERRPTACIRVTTTKDAIGGAFGEALSKVGEELGRLGATPAGPPYARYFRWSDDGVDMEIGFPVSEPIAGGGRVLAGELPGGEVARMVHVGPYDGMSETYEALEGWIRSQGREPGDAPWEVYLRSYAEVQNPSELTTEVVWPVR
jgi:effector-binding domain-containing protein